MFFHEFELDKRSGETYLKVSTEDYDKMLRIVEGLEAEIIALATRVIGLLEKEQAQVDQDVARRFFGRFKIDFVGDGV